MGIEFWSFLGPVPTVTGQYQNAYKPQDTSTITIDNLICLVLLLWRSRLNESCRLPFSQATTPCCWCPTCMAYCVLYVSVLTQKVKQVWPQNTKLQSQANGDYKAAHVSSIPCECKHAQCLTQAMIFTGLKTWNPALSFQMDKIK